jgi:hypothetical protein
VVVVVRKGVPLIVSAGEDAGAAQLACPQQAGCPRGWTAREVEVRELSLGSIEIVVHLPVEVLAPAVMGTAGVTVIKLAKILDALKRISRFAPEVRLDRTILKAEQLEADARVLQAEGHLAAAEDTNVRSPRAGTTGSRSPCAAQRSPARSVWPRSARSLSR